MINKAIQVALFLIACIYGSNAIGSLTPNINTTASGLIEACPGDSLAIVCSHGNTEGTVSRWEVNGSICLIAHDPPASVTTCGPVMISDVTDANSNVPLSSTARTIVSGELNNVVVACRAGAASDSSLVGNLTVSQLKTSGIPVPVISAVSQLSQTTLLVNITVEDTRCVGSYRIDATPQDSMAQTVTAIASSSPVVLSGLDICLNKYSLSGVITTPGGVQSLLSAPVPFIIDLLAINEVTTDDLTSGNQSILEWVQRENPLYPTCISGYRITVVRDEGINFNLSSEARSASIQQFDQAGFTRCTTPTIRFETITPQGILPPAVQELFIEDPDFPTPRFLSAVFSMVNDSVVLTVTIQNVSQAVVSERRHIYMYRDIRGFVTYYTTFFGNVLEAVFTPVTDGQMVSLSVNFERISCFSATTEDYTVPSRNITGLSQSEPGETNQSLSIILPLTSYQPEQLKILSTLSPPHDLLTSFTAPGHTLTVMLTELYPNTSYNFTIRIVLASALDYDVVPSVSGMFTTLPSSVTTVPPTLPPAASAGCGPWCIAGIIVAFLILIIIVIAIVVVLLVCRDRHYHSYSTKTEHNFDDHETFGVPPEVVIEVETSDLRLEPLKHSDISTVSQSTTPSPDENGESHH